MSKNLKLKVIYAWIGCIQFNECITLMQNRESTIDTQSKNKNMTTMDSLFFSFMNSQKTIFKNRKSKSALGLCKAIQQKSEMWIQTVHHELVVNNGAQLWLLLLISGYGIVFMININQHFLLCAHRRFECNYLSCHSTPKNHIYVSLDVLYALWVGSIKTIGFI